MHLRKKESEATPPIVLTRIVVDGFEVVGPRSVQELGGFATDIILLYRSYRLYAPFC